MPAARCGTIPDRDELLELLGESARGGSVTAARTLLDELRRHEGEPEPDNAITRLIAQRKARLRATNDGTGRGRD
jgi:hypothetical protein